MRIIETISDFEKKGCVLTIGNFDGVHIGHQEILTSAAQTAEQRGTELVVMTFEPHPVAVLHPHISLGVLTPLELKKHLLAELGVDCLIVLQDTRDLLRLSPGAFVERFLVKAIQPTVVVEGESFNFGYRRAGHIQTLQQLGLARGFKVVVIKTREAELSTGQTVKVSSTLIRNTLETGSVADAAIALSRPYRLIGQVVPGHGRGKQLGFPTANMKPAGQIIPAEGVYAGFVQIGDSEEQVCTAKEKIPAALSIGRAKTYGAGLPMLIEAHLLTKNVSRLAGKWLAIDFIKRLRDQTTFHNEAELSTQIANDCEKAKQILVTKDTKRRKTNFFLKWLKKL